MSKSMTDRDGGLIVARLVLDILRATAGAMFTGEPFGSRSIDGLLLGAVFIGHAEGRPMNAAKVGEYAGVPRPTAIRRLAVLEREGFVVKDAGGAYLMQTDRTSSPAQIAAHQAAKRAIIAAAKALSKLDT